MAFFLQVNNMEYSYYDRVEKAYNNLYSYGGKTERSFFQNVGKIINKQAFTERPDEVANKFYATVEDIMTGEKKY